MVRRQRSMKFLGGLLTAFPGGKVDPGDAAIHRARRLLRGRRRRRRAVLPRARRAAAAGVLVTAVRELLEESGVLLACDGAGRVVDPRERASGPGPTRAAGARRERRGLRRAAREAGWRCDLRPLRYRLALRDAEDEPDPLHRNVSSSAGCRQARSPGSTRRKTSEGFWIHPGDGYRRFLADEMAMAEPAEYGLAYIAQFRSVDELWAACDDNARSSPGSSTASNSSSGRTSTGRRGDGIADEVFVPVALTVPFALALWVLMFLAAATATATNVLFVVFYAPLLVVSSIGWLTFFRGSRAAPRVRDGGGRPCAPACSPSAT